MKRSPGVSEREFRHALSYYASGVTVVTASRDGEHHGATVTAFCSVSLNPPLILVCMAQGTTSAAMILESQTFAVNILSEDAAPLSRHFAAKGIDKLVGVGHVLSDSGDPLLDESVAVLECRVADSYPAGDHLIVLGHVEATRVREGRRPLLHYRGRYVAVGPSAERE